MKLDRLFSDSQFSNSQFSNNSISSSISARSFARGFRRTHLVNIVAGFAIAGFVAWGLSELPSFSARVANAQSSPNASANTGIPEGMAQSDFPHGVPASTPQDHIARVLKLVIPATFHFRATKPDGSVTLGTGFVTGGDGVSLTCYSLIKDATSIRVMMTDGSWHTAKVFGGDDSTNIGLLQINVPPGISMQNVTLGHTEETAIGDPVASVAMPFGKAPIISLGRMCGIGLLPPGIGERTSMALIDARTGADMVGGPAVAADGRVIGIISSAFQTTDSAGANLAGANAASANSSSNGWIIPISTVNRMFSSYQDRGLLRWTSLGLELSPVRDFASGVEYAGNFGAVIKSVVKGSPADSVGIFAGDRLLEMTGVPINALDEDAMPALRRMLDLNTAGKPITLLIKRGEEILIIDVAPEELP